jgi:hypothetical protein
MTRLYSNESSHPTVNAQRNLMGRTHFVDPDTLRFHKSKVISARPTDNGLLFAIVTSDSLNYENTKRGFRYAIFDLFGTCLDRPDLADAYRTSKQATKAMWDAINVIDAKQTTLEAIDRHTMRHVVEMTELTEQVSKLEV